MTNNSFEIYLNLEIHKEIFFSSPNHQKKIYEIKFREKKKFMSNEKENHSRVKDKEKSYFKKVKMVWRLSEDKQMINCSSALKSDNCKHSVMAEVLQHLLLFTENFFFLNIS